MQIFLLEDSVLLKILNHFLAHFVHYVQHSLLDLFFALVELLVDAGLEDLHEHKL